MKIKVNAKTQTMDVVAGDNNIIKSYFISTASNGMGEEFGSFKTPRGRHIIRAKIGAGLPVNTIFVGRRPTGEIFSETLKCENPDRDWILTRIMWLSGLEVGKNRLGKVDTMRRYVYIHGSPDSVKMGSIGSKGCIRMRNKDIIELDYIVSVGTEVIITE